MKKIGRYQIRQILGQGGMAEVYRAYDPYFEREVAIKVISTHFLHDHQFRLRFSREAKVIASLAHPAIVPVYDFGEQNSQPYLVMRLMPGGSLLQRLQHGTYSLDEAVQLLNRIAPAIDMAHERGIVHRDLKPDNILLDQAGNPYIADFGIAKLLKQTSIAMQLSQTGLVIGTGAYMSPEQASGDKQIDGRSDIYSLGVILFELLTGYRPYYANSQVELLYKHIKESVPSICALRPDLPPECDMVIARAMAKNREQRYATAYEIAAALLAIIEKATQTCKITYQAHVKDIGWMPWVYDGQVAGTTGQSTRMEAICIKLGSNIPAGIGVTYQAHVKDIGWMPWVSDGQVAGTTGQSTRLEALRIKLIAAPPTYRLLYQAHVKGYGWMPWVSDGEIAGTTGQSRRLEALRVQIIKPE